MFKKIFPCLCDCMYHMCIGTHRGQKRVSDLPRAKLDSCKTPDVGANTEPRSSGRVVHVCNCWIISPTYILIFFKENSFAFFLFFSPLIFKKIHIKGNMLGW